jgi:hypothetical protein
MNAADALVALPSGLRQPLLDEYQSIVQNYSEHRWSSSELSGGRFCEIVYTILDGYAQGSYAGVPSKPTDFVGACRGLEKHKHVPRSFQILLPRLLPALFEVRNNRNVGHVGGDVDPSYMDASFVLSNCSWTMAELVRVYHNLSTKDAQQVVDSLADRRIPLIWEGDKVRRVLDVTMSLREQVLVLLATSIGTVASADLFEWTGYHNRTYFSKLLRKLHQQRCVELSNDQQELLILPPGSREAGEIIRERSGKST